MHPFRIDRARDEDRVCATQLAQHDLAVVASVKRAEITFELVLIKPERVPDVAWCDLLLDGAVAVFLATAGLYPIGGPASARTTPSALSL